MSPVMLHYSTIQILVAVVVLAAAATDIRSRRIPNWLTLSGVIAGIAANWTISGLPGLKTSLSGLALGFGVYFVLYCLRAMGAGDVKLMAAVGAIVGPASWIAVFFATAIAGGVLALVLMIRKKRVRETLGNSLFITGELLHFRAPFERGKHLDVKNPNALRMPHGVAIAVGTVTCLLFAVI
jgi:prepilin peptidase CpaA